MGLLTAGDLLVLKDYLTNYRQYKTFPTNWDVYYCGDLHNTGTRYPDGKVSYIYSYNRLKYIIYITDTGILVDSDKEAKQYI